MGEVGQSPFVPRDLKGVKKKGGDTILCKRCGEDRRKKE